MSQSRKRPRVVIIGAGFGGLAAAKALKNAPVDIKIIDKRNLERIRDIRQRCGDAFLIYSGDDATAMDAMLNGANGDISVTANVAPATMAAMCEAAMAGDSETARGLNASIEALHRDLFLESNPIPVKWALCEMGLIDEGIRLPLTPLASSVQEQLRSTLRQCGLLGA